MNNITLLSTAHKENGICNSDELFKIIDKISPDVIYEELSHKMFFDFYIEFKYETLETRAIKRYIQKNPIPHLPVDLNSDELIDINFKNRVSKLFNIFNENIEYRNLSKRNSLLTERFGFQYLNSNDCVTFFEQSNFMEKILLENLMSPEFNETYRNWLDLINRRENSMIKNIYEYGNKNKPKKALFLLGAAHIKSIIEKAEKYDKKSETKFKWIYNSI